MDKRHTNKKSDLTLHSYFASDNGKIRSAQSKEAARKVNTRTFHTSSRTEMINITWEYIGKNHTATTIYVAQTNKKKISK